MIKRLPPIWIILVGALLLRWGAFYLYYFIYKTPGGIAPSPHANEVYDFLARELPDQVPDSGLSFGQAEEATHRSDPKPRLQRDLAKAAGADGTGQQMWCEAVVASTAVFFARDIAEISEQKGPAATFRLRVTLHLEKFRQLDSPSELE